ncbi:MAG: hypothetical protein K8L97_03960 [Anaerolineae bacterium]|nr:hypothetical protein [Anaerolineae bacterium]
MDRISAAGNLTIEVETDRWRLMVNGNVPERVLLEAAPNQPLHYIELFGSKRQLPSEGTLPLDAIQRVVLGWSQEDESWHLGLLLGAEIAQQRGSRWCELARWPDPDTTVFGDLAAKAGRGLARTIACPFNLIEPETQKAAVPAPPKPLRELPLYFDQWTLNRQSALQFTRSPRWARSRILRIGWYAALVVVYIILSVMTLRGVIALPKPEFLPYLGLAVAVLLVGLIGYIIYQLLTSPNRVVVDDETGIIRGLRGETERWAFQKQDVQAIYVSEVMNRRGRKKRVGDVVTESRVIYHGELNLFLQDGRFYTVIEQAQPVDDELTPHEAEIEDAVLPLSSNQAYTDLQMAGLYVAQALGVDCRYDRRVK